MSSQKRNLSNFSGFKVVKKRRDDAKEQTKTPKVAAGSSKTVETESTPADPTQPPPLNPEQSPPSDPPVLPDPDPLVVLPKAIFRTIMHQPLPRPDDPEIQSLEKDNPYGVSAREKFNQHPHKANVLRFILENFEIPDDFETSKAYGSFSGVCYEDRVMSCYVNQRLVAKPQVSENDHSGQAAQDNTKAVPASLQMCYECGEQRHFPKNCPNMF